MASSQTKITPEQESHKLHEAQDLYRQLQVLLTEGELPSLDLLSDGLLKAEQFTLKASQSDMDSHTRKTIEDINALLVSARQLGRNKQIADRLQKISDEAQKALQEARMPNVSGAAKEAAEKVQTFTSNWRPLFYLLLSSRDFRQLILDANRIARRVVYSYTEDIKDDSSASQKFVEGAPVTQIATEVKDKTKEKGAPQMSDDEWNTLQDDVQKVLALLAKEPTYREGIERIFVLLDMFQKNLAQEPITQKAVPHDVHLRRVVAETEDLVATFSGRETLECFKEHLRQLIISIQKNENLHNYLGELKDFILKAKSENEVKSEEFRNRSKDLAHRGREVMRELKDQADLDPFLDSAHDMISNIKNDEFLQILSQHAGIVQSDLSYTDTQGVLQVDTDLLSKLQSVLLPILVDALKYIPVPKIASSDHDREFWLDKVVLCSYDIIPQNIKFHLQADSEISLPDIETKGTRTHLVIKLEKLLTELKDMEFYYRKKTFPELEDHGRVTFRIKGNGAKLTFTYKLLQGPQDNVPKISEGYASFDIAEMEIDFDKSTLKHPLMVPMLTQLFKTQIRMEIERQVEQNLTKFMDQLGERLTSSLKEMNKPFHYGLEAAKKAVKSSQLAQVYEKRREKLE
jgi:hypothetical protein